MTTDKLVLMPGDLIKSKVLNVLTYSVKGKILSIHDHLTTNTSVGYAFYGRWDETILLLEKTSYRYPDFFENNPNQYFYFTRYNHEIWKILSGKEKSYWALFLKDYPGIEKINGNK
jgi:hypothetical protein